ncbi:hypothetical protein ACIP6T_05855 [Pantoea sp. NPDC088449]|uniref:hypothetical protein n=1 Tax=Pantoea sp. NPDC088449 TaxID=3364392 RepID=UPI0038210615
MNTIEEDFKDIQLMAFEFLNQTAIKEKLFFLFKFRRDDWEKWFQIEFAFFIQKNFEVNVERELPAFTNSPLKKDSRFFIDVVYKLEDEKKFVFLEIKCNRSSSALRRGLSRDISKLRHIKKIKTHPKRSSWCIGFHRSCTDHDIDSMKRFISDSTFSKHEVLKLCLCDYKTKCVCEHNKLGVTIVFCGG